jgi:hypothetical protein
MLSIPVWILDEKIFSQSYGFIRISVYPVTTAKQPEILSCHTLSDKAE